MHVTMHDTPDVKFRISIEGRVLRRTYTLRIYSSTRHVVDARREYNCTRTFVPGTTVCHSVDLNYYYK